MTVARLHRQISTLAGLAAKFDVPLPRYLTVSPIEFDEVCIWFKSDDYKIWDEENQKWVKMLPLHDAALLEAGYVNVLLAGFAIVPHP